MQTLRLVVTMMFFSVFSVGAVPQGPAPEANVRINGTTLFVLRSGVGSIGPAERAQVVNQRLQEILKASPWTVKLSVEQVDVGWMISVNDRPVISVTERDAQTEGLNSKTLADRWAGAIQEGLQQVLQENLRHGLWRRIGITLAVILGGIVLLWGLQWSRKRLAKGIEARREKIPPIRFRGLELLPAKHLHTGLIRTLWISLWAGSPADGDHRLAAGLQPDSPTSEYARQVFFWMWKPFVDIVHGVVHYLPNLFYILVIVAVTRIALRAVGFIFEQAHRGVISLEPWVHRDVARPTSQILKAILIVVALFFMAP